MRAMDIFFMVKKFSVLKKCFNEITLLLLGFFYITSLFLERDKKPTKWSGQK